MKAYGTKRSRFERVMLAPFVRDGVADSVLVNCIWQ